jgi:hypothetical protein
LELALFEGGLPIIKETVGVPWKSAKGYCGTVVIHG